MSVHLLLLHEHHLLHLLLLHRQHLLLLRCHLHTTHQSHSSSGAVSMSQLKVMERTWRWPSCESSF